jgi:3-dehydroquinate synthase
MRSLQNSFNVSYSYPVHFIEGLFKEDNNLLRSLLPHSDAECGKKILFIIDEGVYIHRPSLTDDIRLYFKNHLFIELCEEIILVPGGEKVKNDPVHLNNILSAIERNNICRHSFIAAIGGGAVLDLAGYASAIAHRGIRHIRIPTTVLSQNDSGIGVKNGINAFGKKNFIGTFAPPYSVINDSDFLHTLEERDWRAGISEAIKVSLIKDPVFFDFITTNSEALVQRDMRVMKNLIFHCAELHMDHIAGGDPFEFGSSRPLDFGHWSAHKLEQMTSYKIRHGEAVAIGIALDSTISMVSGMLSENEWRKIITLIRDLGFDIYIPEMNNGSIAGGLKEFREHLGGKLTVMLLKGIGKSTEVNHIPENLILESVSILQKCREQNKVEVFPDMQGGDFNKQAM